jgi:hypothetical protein
MEFSTHAMHVFMIAWGGKCETIIKNIKFVGADGDFFEKNVKWPIIRMLGEGDLHFEECEFENIGGNCWDIMDMKNSFISVKENTCDNGRLLYHVNNIDCKTIIKENIVSGKGFSGILLAKSKDVLITKNTFKDFTIYRNDWSVIPVRFSSDCTILENEFINVLDDAVGLSIIQVSGDSSGNTIKNNDYSKCVLPGWTDCQVTPPVGLGYLWLSSDATNNQVFEYITENQVCDQGTNNQINLD